MWPATAPNTGCPVIADGGFYLPPGRTAVRGTMVMEWTDLGTDRNEYGTPKKCKPSLYSKILKDACPCYYSYAFDMPPPLVNCASKEYVITFCPSAWGID
ncbi:hypothetical protein V6N13_122518 [Hibiscus sabdariffa]